MSKNKIPFKSKSKPKTLKQKLQDVYNIVDLETTCKGRCECCKVAMPQMNFCEFSQLIIEIWNTTSRSEKIELICTSLEYFFKNQFEKWGKDIFVKPCMLLSEDGKCKYYEYRPLSCRMYGLWPEKMYNERVDKFEKAYEGLIERDELPLNTQCPYVKRVDDSVKLTDELIENMYKKLDNIDQKIGNFSHVQIQQKQNYRTFHDWLLLKVMGENKLIELTDLMMAADRKTLEDQIEAFKMVFRTEFAKNMPDPTK